MLALLVGIALLVVFGVRGWHQYQYAQRVASGQIQVEMLRGWMTLAYIAKLHHVPESRLREALGLPATGGEDHSLREWFKAAGIDPQLGRQRVEAVILARSNPREQPRD
jgi:hypothetical protein